MKKLYELNPSQEVVKLQCKYTLYKRVINIVTSMTKADELDWETMKEAFNIVAKRNDCLRIGFVSKRGKLFQYFKNQVSFDNIPCLEFNTEEEQNRFIKKITKKAIKYMKGVVVEPYFIKTFDNKSMILLKVCHLVLDLYGLNTIYKDLFEVYDSLKNKTELPPMPSSFEEVIKKDLIKKHNSLQEENNRLFFENYLNTKPEPSYAGLHGKNSAVWQKHLKKNKKSIKTFFVQNDTKGYAYKIPHSTMQKVMEYAKISNTSPANILFFACSLCASLTNDKTKNLLPLELCNCRGSALDKKCAGTKVQSVACYIHIDYDKSFEQNITDFSLSQHQLYRHIGYSDQKFEMLVHKTYNSSIFSSYYSFTYSFIPYSKPQDFEFCIYSNGKCALPAYIAQLYDVNSGKTVMVYDVQTKIISEKDVQNFHSRYIDLLDCVLSNPKIVLDNIKI